MNILDLFVIVRSCDKYNLPYDFYISKYPVVVSNNEPRIGTSNDTNLYRTTWEAAINFCNNLSKNNNLSLAYNDNISESEDEFIFSSTPTQQSFRLPTPREWEYAAHGWSNAKTGDYFSIQKRHFKIPFLDYPTSEEQKVLFEQGYSTVDQLIENHIGIHGMLGYAREWCTPIEKYKTEKRQGIKWGEYYTNYDNDIGYQTVTFKPQDQENIPFRVVLPCQK